MKRTVLARAQDRWSKVIAEQKASGLSARDFCERREISLHSFYGWSKRLREEKGSNFIPVRVTGESSLRITLSNGAELTFFETPDPDWVATLLEKLAS